MILSRDEIHAALDSGEITLDPRPEDPQYSNSSVDLFLGAELFHWDRQQIDQISTTGLSSVLDSSLTTNFHALSSRYLVPVSVDEEGCCVLSPGDLLLGLTREKLQLPMESRIAARVEGRSTLARMGLMVHLSAPTIQLGWSGKIALEMVNLGPWEIKLRPNDLRICQLVFERVGESPTNGPQSQFQGQTSPGGA